MVDLRKVFVVLAFVAGLSLAGCAPAATLKGTSWVLGSLQGQAVIAGTQVTLTFDEDRFYGNDGCNQYSGSYQVNGEKITFDKNIVTTMMACEQPIMDQAFAYITALGQAATYTIGDQQLTLLDAQGKTLATFGK